MEGTEYQKRWIMSPSRSGFNFFTNAIDVTPATIGSWVDVYVSANIPAGSTGVILDIMNSDSVNWRKCDVRKKGSFDDHYDNSKLNIESHRYMVVGVNENRIFQAKLENENIEIWLVGYCDDRVVMFTNGIDKSASLFGSWQDTDVSDEVSSDATGVIVKIVTTSGAGDYDGWVRKKGSTDIRTGSNIRDGSYLLALCGVDENKIFQQYIDSNYYVRLYLVGYTRPPVTWFTNRKSMTPAMLNQWVDKDLTDTASLGANGTIFCFNSISPYWRTQVRKKGSTDDRTAYSRYYDMIYGLCGLDENNVSQIWINNSQAYIALVGYTEVAIPPPEYILTISSTAGGTTDPAPGSYSYSEGTVASVTAIPDSGYSFDRWELDGIVRTENPTDVLMDRDYALHAVFAVIPPPERALTISSTAGGTTDPPPGSYDYPEGTVARITAYPASGYIFDRWELDGIARTENPIDVLMDRDHTLHAVFVAVPPPERVLTISATAGGTTDPAPSAYYYPEGTVARVTAYPSSGYLFDHWELDGAVRTENPIDVLMDADHTLLAVFRTAPPPERTLTISATAGGITDPAPGAYVYPDGTVAQAIAYPDRGYLFDHWLVDGVTRSTDNPVSILMDTDHDLHAVFIEAPPVPTPWKTIALVGGAMAVVGMTYYSKKKAKFP